MALSDEPRGIEAESARHRGLRRALEAGVAPTATSVDGRAFHLRAPIGLPLQRGGYVVLDTPAGPVLGQVVDFDLGLEDGPQIEGEVAGVRYASRVRFGSGAGGGVVLDRAAPFHDAPLRLAEPAEVATWLAAAARPRARLRVGEVLHAPGAPAHLDAGGFGRHTFLCGQSGSGKSYALGVVLERLLLETDLRIVVLDPNSDCVRLPEVRDDADRELARRWRDVAPQIAVRRPGGDGPGRLHLRFWDLDPRVRAAVAGLDPVRDRAEYGVLLDAVAEEAGGMAVDDVVGSIAARSGEGRALAARIRNLGLLEWPVWSRGAGGPGLLDDLGGGGWRCLVVDLGAVASAEERALVAASVLKRLWQRREDRRPVLVVIDEAHNVCPQEPTDALGRLTTGIAVRIAAEGRKFGIHLLVATQRPQKVHENVLSQADNLILMRMNSAADLAHLSGIFSFVPPSLLGVAATLRLGESLVAGAVVPHPMLVRFGGRVAREGGSDVPAAWARPRGPASA